MKITLRDTESSDLELLFNFQLDAEARYSAAFMAENSTDKAAYLEKWMRFLNDPTVTAQTILVDGNIVGSLGKYLMEGEAEITYWLDRAFWGKGIASAAVKDFLATERVRPIYGHVAHDNLSSQKVLEKCGFVKVGSGSEFSTVRQVEVAEYIYRLD